jgi:hypothetical protein
MPVGPNLFAPQKPTKHKTRITLRNLGSRIFESPFIKVLVALSYYDVNRLHAVTSAIYGKNHERIKISLFS